MSKSDEEVGDEEDDVADDHLESVPDGCGCVEVWETLSEHRQQTD